MRHAFAKAYTHFTTGDHRHQWPPATAPLPRAPQVCAEAVRVLRAVGTAYGHAFEFTEAPVGGAAWDAAGAHLPASTLDVARAADAILFGSVGGPVGAQAEPKWKDAERNAILGLRKALSLAVNVRPSKVYPALAHLSPLKAEVIGAGVDVVIVRELLGGAYFGRHHTDADGRFASDDMTYTWEQIEAAVTAGFETCVAWGVVVAGYPARRPFRRRPFRCRVSPAPRRRRSAAAVRARVGAS